MNYNQFTSKLISYGYIIFTITDIDFCTNNSRKDEFTKITILAKNNSNSVIRLWTNFYIVDENNNTFFRKFSYCKNLSLKKNENYYDILESNSVAFTLFFPKTKNICALYYTKHQNYEFGIDFSLDPENSFISKQDYLLVDRLSKKLFHTLLFNIEIVSTKKLSIDQLAYYNLQIEQQEKLCEKNILNPETEIADYIKPYLLNKLHLILQNYHQKRSKNYRSPYPSFPDNYNHTAIRQIKTFEKKSIEGERNDLGNMYFRSSWEANLARILTYKNIQFEYEKEIIVVDDLAYLPDFTLNDNYIIEVKGIWDKASLEKVDAFIRHFPQKHLQIIDYDNYLELNAIYSHCKSLHNWENNSVSIKSEKVAVVGMRFVADISVLKHIKIGDKLRLTPEPENPVDKFAIKVQTLSGQNLGHIEKKFATLYSQKLNAGMTFDVEIIDIKLKVINVKITRNNFETITIPTFLRN